MYVLIERKYLYYILEKIFFNKLTILLTKNSFKESHLNFGVDNFRVI